MKNDSISRYAAINALNKIDVSDGVGISSIACGVQESAITAIQHLPSAQSEQQWTPCSEGPPEEESEVLVTTSWSDVCKAWYSNGKWRAEFINEYDDDEILAWMPLPEPWKEKKMSVCNDTISRRLAIEAIKHAIWDKQTAKDAIDAVCNIPSAQPINESDLIELRDRYGDEVRFVVEDMLSGEEKRWTT